MNLSRALVEHLEFLYGTERTGVVADRLAVLIASVFPSLPPQPAPPPLDERDAILITYGDQFRRTGEAPLQTLAAFCEERLQGAISGIHILPFFPYTSDDGFSVVDYLAVDPDLGNWDDVEQLGKSFRLMFDAVVNHISQSSLWFQEYRRGNPRYTDFFIEVDPQQDLSAVVRPRALPLLTAFQTERGEKWVWTTFSADQVDLNYANPEVLLEIARVLLEYAARGAQIIRLDAIAYLWKEIGTTCIHLEQTHRVVKFFRSLLDEAGLRHVLLITETNVPHPDNISYFGNGHNEAQMVYNFALPPLALHTMLTGSAKELTRWAADLERPSQGVTFFNFLASHDGIGINPARGLLSDAQIEALVARVQAHGGLVSFKSNPDGSQSPYELNISYFDALSNPHAAEPLELQVKRFLVSQAILLSLAGLPGIYAHSLLGSRSWPDGVRQTGRNRSINREKFNLEELVEELEDPGSVRARVFEGYRALLKARASSPAFHPYGQQKVLDCGNEVFAVVRRSPDGSNAALCLSNVTERPVRVRLPQMLELDISAYRNLLGTDHTRGINGGSIVLRPYEIAWFGR